jgi:hypothetical protein
MPSILFVVFVLGRINLVLLGDKAEMVRIFFFLLILVANQLTTNSYAAP